MCRGNIECIELLLNAGAEIDDDIDMYSPDNEEDDEVAEEEEIIDCRPMIRTEVKNRRKRLLFDSFIMRYIEYNPYRGRIYNQCFPTGNIRVASPSIGSIIIIIIIIIIVIIIVIIIIILKRLERCTTNSK
jgi:hypothetical protein